MGRGVLDVPGSEEFFGLEEKLGKVRSCRLDEGGRLLLAWSGGMKFQPGSSRSEENLFTAGIPFFRLSSCIEVV